MGGNKNPYPGKGFCVSWNNADSYWGFLMLLLTKKSPAWQTFLPFTILKNSLKLQTQACETETGIKEEFKKLHQFLKEEENTRLQALKQEEETKTQIMCKKLENIEEQINTLSSTINDIETALKAQDVQLLQVHLLSLFTSCFYLY